MQRNHFLLSLAAFAIAPLSASSRRPAQTGKGFITRKGEGRYHGPIRLKGVNENIIDVKVSGKDTGGAYALFEQTSISQNRGTPLHVHRDQDEIFHVKEGRYRFKVGDDQFDLSEGDTIFLPRRVPHAWTQLSPSGKMLVTMQPAGKLEEFFLALAARTTAPSNEELKQIFADHEMEVVGPPIDL
jgi:quercetin dioxygenase-like cupin family protein